MHAPLRHSVVNILGAIFSSGKRTLIRARQRSKFVRHWTDALGLSIQDRHGYFLIVIALIIFDYSLTIFSNIIYPHDFYPDGAPFWRDFVSNRLVPILWSIHAFTYIGYALFGWLAFQRAQGVELSKAAKFMPIRELFLFFVFATAVDYFAASLTPVYLYGLEYLAAFDSTYWFALGKYTLFSAAFAGVSAYLLFFVRQTARFYDVLYSIAGYLILIHLLHIYRFIVRAPLPESINMPFQLSVDFLITVLWTIFYVAFCILLGQAVRRATIKN